MSYKYFKYNLFVVIFLSFFVFFSKSVLAAQLDPATIRYDRIKINNATNVYVKFKAAGTGTENKVRINFGVGVGVSAVVGGGLAVNTNNLEAGVVALPGTLSITNSGQEVTISGVSDLTPGTTYGFNISNGISTPSSAGQSLDRIVTLTSGDVEIDRANLASAFIVDDQLMIVATVPPIFNFSLSGILDTFTSDLTPFAVSSTTGKSISVITNAAKGWTGWVKSQNAALLSSISGESIATLGTVDGTPSTCTNGNDCYVLDVNVDTTGAGSGSLSVDPEYDGNGTTSGGTLSTFYQSFASRTGKTAGDTLTLKAHASIVSTKAAGTDYSDILTIVGAGNF